MHSLLEIHDEAAYTHKTWLTDQARDIKLRIMCKQNLVSYFLINGAFTVYCMRNQVVHYFVKYSTRRYR